MSSWSNVVKVNHISIAAGSALNSYADLFINGLHQVPVHLYLTFELEHPTQPAPTEEEVRDQIRWVDYATGSDLVALQLEAEANAYCLYYPPVNATTRNRETLANGQYDLEFQFSGGPNAEPGDGEPLSMILKMPLEAGEGSYDGSFFGQGDLRIDFTFIPEQMYSNDPTSGLPFFEIAALPGPNDYDFHNPLAAINVSKTGESLHKIQIADDFFYILDASLPRSDDASERIYYCTSKDTEFERKTENTALISARWGVAGGMTVTDTRALLDDKNQTLKTVTSTVDLPAYSLVTLHIVADVHHDEYDNFYSTEITPLQTLIHDQFGNHSTLFWRCDPDPVIDAVY